ncbi:MAG: DUF4340 domain-containing protein [Nitrosomonadales bacterium]
MLKKWLLLIFLFLIVVSIAIFAFLSDNKKNTFDGYEVSNYRLSDFEEVIVDFPSKAATSFKKINNYWYQTKPFQTRADQKSVLKLLSIFAAKSNEKLDSLQLEKYGLDKPVMKITFIKQNDRKVFTFGSYNPVTEQQYVLFENNIFILDGVYSEIASYAPVELIDKKPLATFEKIKRYDFSRLEQWQENFLQLVNNDDQWSAEGKKINFDSSNLMEWFLETWNSTMAKSVEPYKFDARIGYKSFDIFLEDNKKITFYRIQESPEMLLYRNDEGLLYHFPQDIGFTMLNPTIEHKE